MESSCLRCAFMRALSVVESGGIGYRIIAGSVITLFLLHCKLIALLTSFILAPCDYMMSGGWLPPTTT